MSCVVDWLSDSSNVIWKSLCLGIKNRFNSEDFLRNASADSWGRLYACGNEKAQIYEKFATNQAKAKIMKIIKHPLID